MTTEQHAQQALFDLEQVKRIEDLQLDSMRKLEKVKDVIRQLAREIKGEGHE
ncbi:hypothetical protein MYE70_10375 [Marinobacter alexandrii]|uniref:hypothetical protein n=1 Tax=Marinobacter alexandrii TaxID=2570351 RepID=UPI001FFF1ED8|nr:hypothetical protein [Marinobacter alexandrii]MCK2149471.1 hypothetical protein [Marinobacter alexandrii]